MLDRKTLGDALVGDLVVVRKGRGRARVDRVLGSSKRIENVLEALLVDEGLRTDFEPFKLPDAELEGRADLRDLVAFTIDPETAKDFDDAVSVRAEGDGLRAWVHIADVSWFVPAGSPLDRGAAARANSVYVPGLVAPMLPHELADDACSLRPYVDRLCVTVEFPPEGEPLFYRSVIRSDERFTYGQVQRILDGAEQHELADELRLAERLATELRSRRFERGALRVESREIQFAFDGRGGVDRAWFESEPHAHMLVEELMILANEAVAALLAGRRREALYRVHERPEPQSIQLLLAKLADLGVPTPPAPAAEAMSPADAARVAAEASERVTEYVGRAGRGVEAFPALVLRALKQARYDPENLGHSGLASTAYCHFTSPIRRYPDLVCHRALLRELGQGDDPLPEDPAGLAAHTSLQEREAAQVEWRADEICLAWLLEAELYDRGWEDPFDGEIIGVIPSGLFVRFGGVFEGYVPARRIPGDYFQMNDLGAALVGRRGGKPYRLGDRIEVRVEDIRRTEGKVELTLAERAASGAGRRRQGSRAGRRRGRR
ncbi:MAG TPA: RNB domain-containing ribonuclease [Gaiellaceae bacterium]|nr:RNB domain-containing ribonuclease [Gaiellaceae bacterium]